MKLAIIFILFLTINSFVLTQDLPDYLLPGNQFFEKFNQEYSHRTKHNPRLLKEYIELEKRNYDVLTYDLYMDWYDLINTPYHDGALIRFNGNNIIRLVILEDNLEYIELDAMLLNIESIKINGQASANSNKKAFGILKVDFNEPFNTGDTVILEIKYNYSTTEEGGIFIFEKGTAVDLGPPPDYDTVYIEEKIAYTMSEPTDARLWMPCNDRPYDKAISTITVKVPQGYTVTSNGKLNNVENKSDSSIYYWSHNYPITTYLMHAAASKYHYYYDWYKRVSNPNDSIKIEYYVWEKDFQDTTSDGMTYNATYAFRNSVDMMKYYSTIFGEYPFERYGMVAVQEFWYGGMEHQTITTLHRNVLRKMSRWGGNGDYSNQIVIAHEMAHQWLGDLITCASWNDIWINEGGAVWSEALWNGRNNINNYFNSMSGKMQAYFYYNYVELQPAIYGPDADNVFNYPTTYLKSGCVYYMLSVMFGYEKFLQIMKDMFAEYGFKSLDTEEFKNFLKTKTENPPVDLDTFFNQWVYKPGHPTYMVINSTRTFVENQDYEVTVNLAQLQEGIDVPNVYHTYLWVKFFGPDGVVYVDSLVNKERLEKFVFRLPFKPDSIAIDTIRTLCQVQYYVTSVEGDIENNEILSNIYPNPVFQGNKSFLNLELKDVSFIEIELYDNFGRKISSIHSGYLSRGNHLINIDTGNLSSGVYSIVIGKNGTNISRKFSIIN